MAITIRAAQERDIEFLVGMNRIVHDRHAAAVPEYFRPHEPGAIAELFRSRFQCPEVRVWIASIGEIPAGYVVSVIRERPENAICRARRCYELDEIAVAPAHRQRGVARALVERVLADARAQDVRDVELTAWSFNAEAHAAFAALGFRPILVRFHRESG